jgi:hypothetical protein
MTVIETIEREAKEWCATGLLDDSDKRAVASFVKWLVTVPALSEAFKTGDRVLHVNRNEQGSVTVLEDGSVQVEFDNPTPGGRRSVGVYDTNWFKQHPNMLLHAPSSTAGEGK